jgi:hypothetical protein
MGSGWLGRWNDVRLFIYISRLNSEKKSSSKSDLISMRMAHHLLTDMNSS